MRRYTAHGYRYRQGVCRALRRQVSKSRLLTEWLGSRERPFLYYQALNKPPAQELEAFRAAAARAEFGTLSAMARSGAVWPTWQAALETLGAAVREADGPIVVVLDELPYIVANDASFEATLQAVWDHSLQHRPVLLVLVGSDLAMMEAMTTYGRPLYQRIDAQRQVDPLTVADVADLLALDAPEAFDTYLVTGGFPKVVAARAEHASQQDFLDAAMTDEAHPLVYTGQQMLAAEFPPTLSARAVLDAVGHGVRAFGAIRTRAAVSEKGLADALALLKAKRVLAADDPLAARSVAGRARYRVADPYLRFWLRFLAQRGDDIARGRGDLVAADIHAAWPDYAGAAVEPLVREAIERLLPDARFGVARAVGAYWTRDHQVEVDLVGTAGDAGTEEVAFTGSVKWRARKPFGDDAAAELERSSARVPGWTPAALRVGVSRSGFDEVAGLDVALAPADLLGAWR